jgi:formyl-CoA transferase
MIRVTGFGQTGPYSSQPGYGAIGEAMGGLRYVVGDPDRQPARTGISLGDTLAATFGAVGGLVALEARHRTGKGQIVDSAIYESVLNIMESLIPEYAVGGYTRERTGAILPNVAPSNVYPTLDGMLLIAANQDTVWRRLADAMGRSELGEDERYATHTSRGENQQELDDLISQWTSSLSTAELREKMLEHGVPHGPIYKASDMLSDPHFKARNAIVNVPHPQFGEIPMQNVAPKLSMTPGAIVRPAPELGEHNDEILTDILGLSADEIAQLVAAGHV